MTRLTLDFATMQKENIPAVSADVMFLSSRFPNYKIGSDNQVLELKDNMKTFSMKEIVAKETAMLLEQQKRLSVRDLAHKFEKGLAAAAKLSVEDKLKEAASLEKHVLLKNLRDALEALRGRVTGKNKDAVETAVSMVEALAVQLAKREGELLHEKEEVKRLANFLKQASEEAKKLDEEERSNARAEIENTRAAVQRVEEAIQEHEQMARVSGEQDYEDLIKEVQEARRIKMLHQPSKVMDMEYELRALRTQFLEKTSRSVQLQKELAMNKTSEDHLYEMIGQELLGSCLMVQKCFDEAVDLSKCLIQWYRVASDTHKKELISDGSIVACVDVLQLTHAAISMVESSSGAMNEMATTMMQKFWDSALALEAPEDTDSHSEMSTALMNSEGPEGKYPSFNLRTSFSFKFKGLNGSVHRFNFGAESLDELIAAVVQRIGSSENASRPKLFYEDDESDKVLLICGLWC